jgi:hypothetical protein
MRHGRVPASRVERGSLNVPAAETFVGREACGVGLLGVPAEFFVVGDNMSYELEADLGTGHTSNHVTLWPSFNTFTGFADPLECFPTDLSSICPDTSSGSGVLTPGPYAVYVGSLEGPVSFTLTLTQ